MRGGVRLFFAQVSEGVNKARVAVPVERSLDIVLSETTRGE